MLVLGEEFVEFEVDSQLSDIFFDNVNQKICTVRGNGAMGVTAKGLEGPAWSSFRIRDGGKINTLNFSTDGQICCVQRKENSCDFVFLEDKTNDVYPDYKQNCRAEATKIMGAQWVAEKQIVYVTDGGLELYQFNSKRKTVKFVKAVSFRPNWFVYHPKSDLIICASGVTAAVLNPFIIQNGFIHKLQRFEIDFGCSRWKPRLLDRDLAIASLYGRIYVMVLKFGPKEHQIERLNLFLMSSSPDTPPKLAFSLVLGLNGPVGIHTIDNLVIVHHKNSAKSLIFDIGLQKTLIERHPVATTNIRLDKKLKEAFNESLNTYHPAWVTFAPNLIADVRLGIFSTIGVGLEQSSEVIKDNMMLLDFIINRKNSEQFFLKTLKNLLLTKALSIRESAEIFARILQNSSDGTLNNNKEPSSKFKLVADQFEPLKVDYNQIVRSVLVPLKEEPRMDRKFLSAVALEFYAAVKKAQIPLEHHYLAEFLIRTMVDANETEKLKQCLQYSVVDDSKFLAFELISLSKEKKEFGQLALDMLKRKPNNKEQIAEFHINQGEIINALRVLRSVIIDKSVALRILEETWKTEDRKLKYMVFTHLRDVRKLPWIDGSVSDDQFDTYIRDFKQLFNNEELEEADQRFRLAKISSVASLQALNPSPSRNILNASNSEYLNDSIPSSFHSDFDMSNAPGAGIPNY
ncbi:unnamed protein product [Bursaphelenchus okinawaensis]|uniref:Mic1 domain-containing protein n=1 Tax=Bursaphelenchus okinawaensis TaxID=465554 RepID=A0A811LEC9_9BILA|nr:unnamed protein product [Bursaphelenchus okinawaensis]CAG9121481.1 unnamed protein product [Bursaphelenchus okinawaensis]